MSQSNLSHTVADATKSTGASATGSAGLPEGNTTSAAGASNPSTGSNTSQSTSAQETAGTLPADFTLANTKAESKGDPDKVKPNQPEEEAVSGQLGNDHKRTPFQSHDLDIPKSGAPGANPNERTGEVSFNNTNKA